jgi:hypothetical protein
MFRSVVALASFAALSFSLAACSGSPDGSSADETSQDIKSSACAPVETLTCAADHEVTTDGCASPRYVGAPTYGRCVVSSDKAKLVGTFENDPKDADDLLFWSFTFKTDGSYSARGGCRPGGEGAHCFAIIAQNGTWALAKSGPQLGAPLGAEQLVLTPDFGDEARYFYSIDNGTLSLSEVMRGQQSVFTKQ